MKLGNTNTRIAQQGTPLQNEWHDHPKTPQNRGEAIRIHVNVHMNTTTYRARDLP